MVVKAQWAQQFNLFRNPSMQPFMSPAMPGPGQGYPGMMGPSPHYEAFAGGHKKEGELGGVGPNPYAMGSYPFYPPQFYAPGFSPFPGAMYGGPP